MKELDTYRLEEERERQLISLSGEAGWEGIELVKRELYRQSLLGVAIDEKFPIYTFKNQSV